MGFDSFELSRWLGRPEHLFVFALQNRIWRYCSGTQPVVFDAGQPTEQIYLPAAISRSKIVESPERKKNNITIKMPYLLDPNAVDKPVTQPLGDIWRPYPPSGIVSVTCLSYHVNDPDLQTTVEWSGRAAQPKFTDAALELTCEPTSGNSTTTGNGGVWSRGCQVVLYSQGLGMCNVDPALHAFAATLTSVSGLTLKAAAFAASPKDLAGGYIEWTSASGIVERRDIMAHTGDAIVVNYGARDLAPELELIALPGCPHNWDGCESFDNTDNYGGCMYLSGKNPFAGNPVW